MKGKKCPECGGKTKIVIEKEVKNELD